MSSTPRIDNIKPKLDAVTLEGRAEHLPESMRELFIWLGSHCREQCNSDMDILHASFVALGYTHDKTTWSKILRGMWNTDAGGKLVSSPCLAEAKFIKAVTALRNDSRLQEQRGAIPFVMTPTAQEIFDYLDLKRADNRVNKFGVIIGETGTQKSATLKEYCRRNNHGSCVIIEAPETPSMVQFMTDLALAYGFKTYNSYQRKKSYVLECVNHKRTVVVENIQRLYDARAGDRQPIFSFLQKLQEDTRCTIILTFTPTFETTLMGGLQRGFFEQFEGRAGGRRNFLRLDPFPGEDDVIAIAKAFGLQHAEKYGTELSKIVQEPGRVRILFEDLQEAKIDAETAGKPLTIGYVRAARNEVREDAE